MASLLAQQDQENLAYGHQTAAAAKPLNQGNRALAPKTPGNKTAKTPFKIPLHDENGIDAIKTGAKKGKGNGNLFTGAGKTLGDKNAFVTPVAPKARAPLGQKTTNAKARPFQTPAPLQPEKDLSKSKQKSVSARKPKLKVPQAEPAKIDLLETKDEEEPEIEYMPPRSKELPDFPSDIDPNIDVSMFENNGAQRDFYDYLQNHKGWDGLSAVERDGIRKKRANERYDAEELAMVDYVLESDSVDCFHDPECPTQECKDALEIKRKAKAKYDKKMAEINAHFESLPSIGLDYLLKPTPAAKKPVNPTKGLSTVTSRTVASALANTKPKVPALAKPGAKQPFNSKLASSLVSRPKKPVEPTNPSSMRHAAAKAASNTTIGYAKGRAASAAVRKALDPKSTNTAINNQATIPDPNSLSPEAFMKQHGEPRFGTEMWWRCRRQGLIKMPSDIEREEQRGNEETEILGPDGKSATDYLFEEAERDFEMRMPF